MIANQSDKRDPVFLNCRRETIVILVAWAVFFLWVTGYCGFAGYNEPGKPVELVLGMPSWVFWGVFVPWFGASAFTVWFALGFIADDPLEHTGPGAEGTRKDTDSA